MKAVFRNLESPGIPLSFNRQFVDYHFEADKEYEITESIFDHINGLGTPRYEFRQDPGTGIIETKKVGWNPRFSFTEVREKAVKPVVETEAPLTKSGEPDKRFGTTKKEPVLAQV